MINTYRVERSDILASLDVPLENLKNNGAYDLPITAHIHNFHTLVPNLDWSLEAPTTAYLGEDKKVFLISPDPDMV